MLKVIAIINQKGGVGKTATTCNLAASLSKRGKKILIIDLDPSANATRIFCDGTEDYTVRDLLLFNGFDKMCLSPARTPEDSEVIPNLKIIPSHIRLSLAERELTNKPFRETLLDKKLNSPIINGEFDYVLLDCPPTLTTLTINAMYAADLILVPVTYAKDAIEGIADIFELLDEIKDGHVYEIAILRNQFDARKKTANGYVSETLAPFIDRGIVLKTIIRQDEEVNKASINGETVIHSGASKSAADDYEKLTTEVIELCAKKAS